MMLASRILAATLALSAVSATAASAQTSPPLPSAGVTTLLTLDRWVEARAWPNSNAPVVKVVPNWTPLTHSPMTLPVIQMADGGLWLRVRLPMRPDGGTGWVPNDAGFEGSTGWEIVVHVGARSAVVLDQAKVQATFPIIVGKASTPTPTGTYFVVEMLSIAPGVAEGPWALATSAYSNVLQQYDGGDGEVALHGTTGLVGQLGTFASHGCIRFAPWAISWIANHVVAGTPVIITN